MKTVISEYASEIVSLLSAVGLITIATSLFLGENGLFAKLIISVVGGG